MKLIFAILIFSYHLIPAKYYSRWNIYQDIIPNDSIVWWQYGLSSLNRPENYKILFSSDPSIKFDLPLIKYQNTYCSYYFGSYPSVEFLVYKTKSGNLRFINDEKDLIKFIGSVDNLSEALFISSIYGYICDKSRRFGSYRFINNEYYLKLYKIINPPDVIDNEKHIQAKLKINKDGEIFVVKGKRSIKLNINDMHRIR